SESCKQVFLGPRSLHALQLKHLLMNILNKKREKIKKRGVVASRVNSGFTIEPSSKPLVSLQFICGAFDGLLR
ncbi:MAG: hypothetical protein ACP5O3_01295, partial [Candidatus Micrarchaeia archaeon]